MGRRIDCGLGILLTLALTLVRNTLGWMHPIPTPPAQSILLVKLAEQGSTVLAFDNNRFIVDALDLIPVENVITINESA